MTNFMMYENSKETPQTAAQRKKIIIDRHNKPILMDRDRDTASSELKSCLNDSQELGRTSLLDSFINNSVINHNSQENRTIESPRGETAMGPIGLENDDINIVTKQKGGLVGNQHRVELEELNSENEQKQGPQGRESKLAAEALRQLSPSYDGELPGYNNKVNGQVTTLYQAMVGESAASTGHNNHGQVQLVDAHVSREKNQLLGGGIVFQGESPKYGIPPSSASYMLKNPSEESLAFFAQERLRQF